MAKMYAPHNYDIYSDRLGMGREAAAEKYRFVILEVGGACKFICHQRHRRRGGKD
jgi:hypothetical protein